MAGESGNIYAYSFKCIKDSQCGPGYDCRKPSETEEPRCYALDPVPGDNGGGDDVPGIGNDSGPPAGDLASASCEPGFVACDGNRRMSCQDDGTWAFAENCAATGATCSSGACVGGGNSGGGCSAAPIGTSAPWLLMLALMAGIAAIRRPPA
jgi:MYXO-CTERM domain-containing protein